jgi:hypothetical protein
MTRVPDDRRARLGAAYGLTVVATALVAFSCSSPSPLGTQGSPCSTPDDCASNLDCVQQTNGTRICSSNLGPIVHTEEAGMEAGTTPGEDATLPSKDGGATSQMGDSGTTMTQQDSGSPPPPPQDSGSPPPPPQDSGSPPPPQDSGSPPPPPGDGGGD